MKEGKFYRTKPSVVSAIQYTGESKPIDEFLGYNHGLALYPGYWVVKDKEGYYQIYSNEEFNKTFETV